MMGSYECLILTILITNLRLTSTADDDSIDTYTDLYDQAPSFLLKVHNSIRHMHNIPPLEPSQELNDLSRHWAEKLAREREFYHKPYNEFGENIYFENYVTGLHFPGQFVYVWYEEKKFLRRKMRFHELYLVSNFTQIIWKNTKYLGVAAVANHTNHEVYLVCMYDPPGNIVDEFNDNIDLDEFIPELEFGLARQTSSSYRNLPVYYLISIAILSNVIYT